MIPNISKQFKNVTVNGQFFTMLLGLGIAIYTYRLD